MQIPLLRLTRLEPIVNVCMLISQMTQEDFTLAFLFNA